MNQEQYLKNLTTPNEKIDVVLDTDAYNEIDDQFAISYMLRCTEKMQKFRRRTFNVQQSRLHKNRKGTRL